MTGTVTAGALVVLAGLLLAGSAGAQERIVSQVMSRGKELPEETPLNPLSAMNPAELDAFLGRPLFSPTRRPPPAPVSAPPAPTEAAEASSEPPALRLVGILRTPRESVAQLIGADGTQRFSVRLGDFLDGWTVAAIDVSTLTLKKGDQEASLTIFRGQAASTDPQTGVAPAAKPGTQPARKRIWTQEDRKGFFGD